MKNKRSHSVGYFSSYDRGLTTLLELWPDIHAAVPDATLDIYYGWNAYDEMHKSNPAQMKWKWQVIRKIFDLKDMGVTERGRVSHKELAEIMKRTKVWAYPTTFAEISCIIAMKTQAAGMIPVTSHCYALKETVLVNEPSYEDIDINETAKKEFTERVIKALLSDELPDPRPAIEKYSWSTVAKLWDNALSESNTTSKK